MLGAEKRLEAGEDEAGIELADAVAEWSDLGGYELEAQWDSACRRTVRAGLTDVGDRSALTLSGGERKGLVLDLLFGSEAEVLLLDEPDNFLDVPAKERLEERIAASRQTVLMISHDRAVLSRAVGTIVTLEGHGAWVHGGSYATYPEARDARQKRLGDALARWQAEDKRLRELVRLFKERAKYSTDWAKRADAMETRWKRHAEEKPPPPVTDRSIRLRIRGGDSARKVLDLRSVGIDGLVHPFSDEIHFGERVGLIGPNGSGKTHLMRALAGEEPPGEGEVRLGNRVSAGFFTQLGMRPTWSATACSTSCSAGCAAWSRRPWARSPATGSSTRRAAHTTR